MFKNLKVEFFFRKSEGQNRYKRFIRSFNGKWGHNLRAFKPINYVTIIILYNFIHISKKGLGEKIQTQFIQKFLYM